MQYDLKNDLSDNTLVALKWHGEDTRVQTTRGAEKVTVKTGEVIKVSLEKAKELIRYSYLWTFEEDKPVVSPYDAMRSKEAKKAAKSNQQTDSKEAVTDPMRMNKNTIIAKLKELGLSYNSKADKDELAALLEEALAAEKENEEAAKTDEANQQTDSEETANDANQAQQ